MLLNHLLITFIGLSETDKCIVAESYREVLDVPMQF